MVTVPSVFAFKIFIQDGSKSSKRVVYKYCFFQNKSEINVKRLYFRAKNQKGLTLQNEN